MPFATFRFIIIEKNDFFAQDMQAGLHEACPLARILRVSHSQDAVLIPHDLSCRTVIITSDRLSVIDDSGLATFADGQDALIVVRPGFDTEAEVIARGFEILDVPFTDAALLAFTQRMEQAA